MKPSAARMESPLERATRFALAGGAVGMIGGGAFALPIYLGGAGFLWQLVVGFGASGLLGGFVAALVGTEGVGGIVAFMTGGGRGHTRPEYSYAQALVARGAYREAVAAYRDAADAEPDDPRPLLLGARVLRDNLRDPEEAAAWLRRAGRIEGLTEQAETALIRELVELFEGPLAAPGNVLPDLARVAERYRGTSTGEWAERQRARLHAGVWNDVKAGDVEGRGR